jgi:hypothetical protein
MRLISWTLRSGSKQEAPRVRDQTRLEGFVLCPNGPIENMEHHFFGFRWQKREEKGFISIYKSGSLRKCNPISLTGHIGRRKLHLFVKATSLLFLEYLTEVSIQAKKGGGHSSLSHKFVCHRCTTHCVDEEAKFVL